MKLLHKNQKGLTLIELLVVLPIIGIIVAAASGATIQVIQSSAASAHMTALRQVQTAGYWVSRDALQAQEAPYVPAYPGFPFTLTWTDSDDGEEHQVIYSLVNMPSGTLKKLQRVESVDGTEIATTMVSQYIDSSQTSCEWDDVNYVLTFTVTASVAGARGLQTETRTYEIQPRPEPQPPPGGPV